MGTLNKNGDPKTEKGPHGDSGPQMGIHVGAVSSHKFTQNTEIRDLDKLIGTQKIKKVLIGTRSLK